ncbi:MAG: hypothetical protein A2487_12680 [Candidatus Raymondbacteria bacterium RifOxyC12_full_50_8]|uniref:Mce/MlaD domain-containing protein n=1 Tax=Candidatus Raymondbacteria bacterium RIFOXYD12_FULL_49_13 TaxID=1817890 RepID=A0A1F7FC76_UNCRA|nr:MAG: hypothetical protein A2248_03080 [Candidatus Raymondbacteria bacterium RIFOXYA2_FULL_49_16]OGJ93462.1 MAG: hypothetical protein A2350_19000 [Candidatus Raymondbacteria bacterium RifOxyB12_full_50_8]OGK04279.1 MAG: hypothetical protein A2519_18125 [Candidatus Raymondbacteria bacterium RIFOXYD12_FULL_49_13]OGK07975.1 MAG: hypothetical protein A2487_12680 [Candidatus Raymondbacteria bacterium RifOxyC12_full_50_8]OGP42438.1 MAG: hypothetical protein A2324_17115 [Candidatus Raymondbacteria b
MNLSNKTVGYITIAFLFLFFLFSSVYVYYSQIYLWCFRTAYADDIGNLKIDNAIKVSGIIVGKVHAVLRENNQAKIVIKMRKDIEVKRDYALLNIDIGLMGDRCLMLVPGFSDQTIPVTEPLAMEFVPGIAEGISNASSLKYIVRDLTELFAAYAQVDSTNDTLFTTQFHTVLHAIDKATLKIEDILIAYEPSLRKNISQAASLSRQGRVLVSANRETVQHTLVKTEDISHQACELMEKLQPQMDRLATLLDETNKGKNSVGKLLADKKLYTETLDTILKVRELLKIMESDGIQLDIDLF